MKSKILCQFWNLKYKMYFKYTEKYQNELEYMYQNI